MTLAIGVDVGGSAIKVAAVEAGTGERVGERVQADTPEPSTPDAVIAVILGLIDRVERAVGVPGAAVGVTVPAVVIDGVVRTAANIDRGWIGFPVRDRLSARIGERVLAINDADAAGIAEMRFGAGRGRTGTVITLTLGTGVGSAIFVDGRLVPNTELGHMEIRGRDAEDRSAAIVRVREHLSWEQWAANVDEHLRAIHRLFWPQLFILGGGVSEDADRFLPLLRVPCEIVPAHLRNDAGAVGAATLAVERVGAAASDGERRSAGGADRQEGAA